MIESKEALVERLAALPEETERIYEKRVMDLAMVGQKPTFEEWARWVSSLPDDAPYRDIRELLRAMGLDGENHFDRWVDELMDRPYTDAAQEKITFAAFCIRMGQLRRRQDRTREFQVMNEHRERFARRHPFFGHLYLMCLLDEDPVAKADKILRQAEENIGKMPENAGVHHALAIAVADIFEATEFDEARRPDPVWLSKGIAASETALEAEWGYAKFHCTQGRLLALQGSYGRALEEIATAIDLEDSSKSDYALRIGSYRMYAQRIGNKQRSEMVKCRVDEQIAAAQDLVRDMEFSLEDMKTKQAALEEETRGSLTKNMEFLGLFAGIVSFTIGGISIAGAMAEKSFVGAAGLLVVLMGALLTVFAGFGIILHGYRGEKSRRNAGVLALGMGIAAVGVILCFL